MAKKFFNNFTSSLKSQFAAGLLIIVPIVLTAIIILFLFNKLDAILGPILYKYLGAYYVKGLGLILLIIIIWFIGILTKNYFGKQLVGLYEKIISGIPIFNTVFGSIKQISDNLLSGKSKSFKQVVLVNFPFYGTHAIAFLTSSKPAVVKIKNKRVRMLHVFMPTTPNPTSGFLMLIPAKDISILDISVENGLKAVISMGVVHPTTYKLKSINSLKNKSKTRKIKKTKKKRKK